MRSSNLEPPLRRTLYDPGPPDTETTNAQTGGGKKESDSLIILQTFLLLNTFRLGTNLDMLHIFQIGAWHPHFVSNPQNFQGEASSPYG